MSMEIISQYKENLVELKALAEKLGYEYFAERFDTAYKLLDYSITPNYDDIPDNMKDWTEDMKRLVLARNVSYVFGCMGSWNDDPKGKAEAMGLKDEYERLTNELILNQKKAYDYLTNEC